MYGGWYASDRGRAKRWRRQREREREIERERERETDREKVKGRKREGSMTRPFPIIDQHCSASTDRGQNDLPKLA